MEPQDKRQLILAAAAEIFAAQGFHQATIEQIAEAAGVGKGTVYLYFKSKRKLFDSLLLESLQRLIERTKEAIQTENHPLARLRRLTNIHLHILQRNHPLLQMILREFTPEKLQSLRPELEQCVQELMDLYVHILQEGIADGALRPHNPQVAALAFLGAVNQVGVAHNRGHLPLSLAEREEELYQLFVAGLQKSD